MTFEKRLELSELEKQYPSAEYYNVKPPETGPLELQLLHTAQPIKISKAIQAEDWMELIHNIESYTDGEYGYCMLDEKRGYMANYLYWTDVKPEMNGWWYRWINIRPKGVPESDGSLHYKLWYPGEHFDHGFINGVDRSGGYYSKDYDENGNIIETLRYAVDVTDFGVSKERLEELKAQGYVFDCAWEMGEGGMHLSLNAIHKLPNGHIEKRTRTWIGYGVRGRKVVKDENACCTEEMLKNMLHHQSVEGRYLNQLMPELYNKFGMMPDDEV